MVAITVNPYIQTSATDTLRKSNSGAIQGSINQNIGIQFELKNSILNDPAIADGSENPLLFGQPVVNFTKRSSAIGLQTPYVRAAKTGDVAATVSGFSTSFGSGVSSYISAPSAAGNSDSAPFIQVGGNVTHFDFGSKAQILVRINNTLAATLAASPLPERSPLMWDYTNGEFVAWVSGTDAANLQFNVKTLELAVAGTETTTAFKISGGAVVRDGALSLILIEL